MCAEVFLPVMGETMDDGAVAVWLAHTGDHVRRGQVVAEIETNKAVFDLESPCAGVLRVLVRSELMVPVLTVLALVETEEPEENRAPVLAPQAVLAMAESDAPREVLVPLAAPRAELAAVEMHAPEEAQLAGLEVAEALALALPAQEEAVLSEQPDQAQAEMSAVAMADEAALELAAAESEQGTAEAQDATRFTTDATGDATIDAAVDTTVDVVGADVLDEPAPVAAAEASVEAAEDEAPPVAQDISVGVAMAVAEEIVPADAQPAAAPEPPGLVAAAKASVEEAEDESGPVNQVVSAEVAMLVAEETVPVDAQPAAAPEPPGLVAAVEANVEEAGDESGPVNQVASAEEAIPVAEETLPADTQPEPPDPLAAAGEFVEKIGGAPEPAAELESPLPGLVLAAPEAAALPARPFVSPRARRLARELSLPEDGVPGSGPGGRVEERDVRKWSQNRPLDVSVGDAVEASASVIAAVRQVVATRMSRSDQMTAPVTLVTEADATELVGLRQRLNSEVGRAGAVEISYDALLVRLTALALAEHPYVNALSTETGVEVVAQLNLGVATETPRGLLVSVVRDAGGMDLWRVASALAELTSRARAGDSGPDELAGGTFTITNLGAYGVDAFTPVINWPECATLGVGRIVAKPAVYQGQVVARQLMTLSLTFDHRAMDGAQASRFLQRLVQLIQMPEIVLKG